jgi:hypothetical protein
LTVVIVRMRPQQPAHLLDDPLPQLVRHVLVAVRLGGDDQP